MAGSLKTAFFNLAKYAANDITSWLTDFNGNMDKIDTAMNQNKTAAKNAQDSVDNLEAEYKTVVQTLAQHTTAIDTNEKAIASNTASIEELGNEVNSIIIGDYEYFDVSNTTKIETLMNTISMWGRRIGNGVEMHGTFIINAGTLHIYDRQVVGGVLKNNYFTDIWRTNGNPLNLPANVYCPISCAYVNYEGGVQNVEGTNFCIVYLPDSGYTAFGITSNVSTQYVIGGTSNHYIF